MSKPRVTFKFNCVAEGDWQIEAHHPGAEIRYIRGFKTKAEVDEWLAGSRRMGEPRGRVATRRAW
jgi:hypothetical protein